MSIANSASEASMKTGQGEHDRLDVQTFGFWLYILSDLILFSILFSTFALLGRHFAGGPTGHDLFHIPYVFIETMLLLTSSATCGVAMINVQQQKINISAFWLLITFLLGLGFVIMEISEFHRLVLDNNGPSRSAFLSSFFTLVSTHGAHVTAGLIWILVMIVQLLTSGISLPVRSRLIRMSIFWHFLDIVWVGVFTLVYLRGVLK